ncbi:pleckstrin homology domain-containing family A member 7-like isoform X2 [Narcine bancroftii]|uniref:pleckstrin homology domain-containing family A member 7-like isoform X2 n=1 Tax=Narcine bancroftii TaxID=1343680 RepID=UPI003831E55E
MSEPSDRPRSELSQGSSIGTMSSLTTSVGSKPIRPMKKVHTFGKREQAIKRDPNSATMIRGWLNKQDSSGLKLWKRRWFVLSDFCLFYYRDSREERILGSIPMPSYVITGVDPQDRKSRKFAFKVEHPGMRTYCFSADTQEDMNGWIRAMSQSARVESEFTRICPIKSSKAVPQERQYSSFKDLTDTRLLQHTSSPSTESLEVAKLSELDRHQGPCNKLQKDLEACRREALVMANCHGALPLVRTTPPARSCTVPPPTPTGAFQSAEFGFEDNSKPDVDVMELPRKASLSHVEQWVQSQKGELPEGEEDEPFLVTTAAGHVYKCLADGSPAQQSLGPSRRSPLKEEPSWPREPGKAVGEQEGWCHPAPCGLGPRPRASGLAITSYRSNSLPAAPEPPKYQVLRRSLTPDERPAAVCEVRGGRWLERPAARNPFPAWSQREQPASGEAWPAAPALARPHTPVGRIDVLPPQPLRRDGLPRSPPAVSEPPSFLAPVRLHSRPQTPTTWHDMLPTPAGRTHRTLRNHSQAPGPFHQIAVLAPDDRDIEASRATVTGGWSGPWSRPFLSTSNREAPLTADRSGGWGLSVHRPPTHNARYTPPPPSFISRLGGTLKLSAVKGASSSFTHLPPRPPTSPRACPSPLLPSVRRLSIAPLLNGGASEIYQEFAAEPVKMAESEVDVLLTRLCGQDRILQGLVAEATPLKAEKDKLEGVLEVIRGQLLDFRGQQNLTKKLMCQQRILQEELIQTRAKLCDLSTEMEQAWNDYEFLEDKLECLQAPRELMSRCGSPQERREAQRDLWMMQDVMLGLQNNKKSFQVAIESTRHPGTFASSPIHEHHSVVQLGSLQSLSPLTSPSSGQPPAHCRPPLEMDEPPCRPPLPHEHCHDEATVCEHSEAGSPSQATQYEVKDREKGDNSITNENYKGQLGLTVRGTGRRGRMSAEEQMERMKRHLQARSQDRTRVAQRSVAVSPIVRSLTEPKASTPESHPRTLLPKRPQASHLSGIHLTASAVPSHASPGNGPTITTQAATMGMPGSPSMVASSKLVTKILAPPTRVVSQSRENGRVVRKEGKPSAVTITPRYIDVDPELYLSPEQLQEKQRTLEKVKTMITKASPCIAGSWSPPDQATYLGEGGRHRIVSLSYALATEACQRRKVMAAKTLGELEK